LIHASEGKQKAGRVKRKFGRPTRFI